MHGYKKMSVAFASKMPNTFVVGGDKRWLKNDSQAIIELKFDRWLCAEKEFGCVFICFPTFVLASFENLYIPSRIDF